MMSMPPSSTPATGLSLPFSLLPAAKQQATRLLELPDELVDLITAAQQTHTSEQLNVRLKSLSSGSRSLASAAAVDVAGPIREQLHLCTEDKVWSVRQVNTSNSVFVVAPHGRFQGASGKDGSGEDVEMMDGVSDINGIQSTADPFRLTDGIMVISQANNVLELVPVQVSIPEIENTIRELVPVYSSLQGPQGARTHMSRKEVVDNIPAPDKAVEVVLNRLCAFEWPFFAKEHIYGHRDKICYLPSGLTLLEVWRKIIEGCAIAGISLSGPLDVDRVVSVMQTDEDEDMYGSQSSRTVQSSSDDRLDLHQLIARTMMRQMLPALGCASSPGPLDPPSKSRTSLPTPPSLRDSVKLDPRRTTAFLGRLVLKSETDSLHQRAATVDSHQLPFFSSSPTTAAPDTIPVASFLATWRSLIPPEQWWRHVTLSNLGPQSTFILERDSRSGQDTILWTGGEVTGVIVDDEPETTTREGDKTAITPTTATGAVTASSSSGSGTTKNRKWHERFAAQRNRKK